MESKDSKKMTKKDSKLNIDEGLHQIPLSKLDEHILQNAKTRVWNRLSHSINNLNSNMSEETPVVNSISPSFWQKYHKGLSLAGVAVLVVASTIGTTYYLANKNNIGNGNTQVAQVQNTSTPTVTIQDNIEIKKLAAAKFKDLTGIEYEEYKKVESSVSSTNKVENTKQNVESAFGQGSTLQYNPTNPSVSRNDKTLPYPNINPSTPDNKVIEPTLLPEKAKEIVQKAEENKVEKSHYTESEIKIHNLEDSRFGLGYMSVFVGSKSNPHPNIDYSKPLTLKNWSSSASSKSVLMQGDKVINMNIYTPEYSFEYAGGKYAIKTNYTGDNSVNLFIESQYQNPDLQFIKYVLENNTNIKNIGTQVIDGKTLTVYEEEQSNLAVTERQATTATETKSTIKYYVDLNAFKIYMLEMYSDNKLTESVKNIVSKGFADDQKDQIKSYDEIKNLEVKNITQNQSYTDIIKQPKISEFIKDYQIYYVANSEDYINGAFNYKAQKQDESLKLRMTKDFDPMYESFDEANALYGNPVGNYYQNTISVDILETEPSFSKERFGFGPDQKVEVKTSTKTIKVNGVDKQAKIAEVLFTYEPNADADKKRSAVLETQIAPGQPYTTQSTYLVFKADNGFWYQFSEYAMDSELSKKQLTDNNLNITLLTPEKAREMDDLNEKVQNAYPKMIFDKSLDNVSSSVRLLPGDLSSYNLVPTGVTYSGRKSSESTCSLYSQYKDSPDCLIETYNGFSISFSDKSYFDENKKMIESNDPGFVKDAQGMVGNNYMNYTVINAPLSTTKQYIGEGKTYREFAPDILVRYKEIDGKTVIVSGSKADVLEKILSQVSLNNGYDILKKQIDEALKLYSSGNGESRIMYAEPMQIIDAKQTVQMKSF